MEIPENLKYTDSHEWVRIEGDTATVGITDYAQEELGDVVYVELPDVGANFEAGDEAAGVESTKAHSDIYAPLTGEIVAVNEELEEDSALINNSPYAEGWIFKLKIMDGAEMDTLMDAETYKQHVS
jgi:glycine cleavage system H protein